MSSEALEGAQAITRAMECPDRNDGYALELLREGRVALDALLAEVARLELERDTARTAHDRALTEYVKLEQERDEALSVREGLISPVQKVLQLRDALAVAREREQRLAEGLGRAYRDSDTGERCVIARLCDVYLDRSGALLGRVRAAALVDEPAADEAQA